MMKKFNKLYYTLIMEQNTNGLYNAFLSIIPQLKKIDVDDQFFNSGRQMLSGYTLSQYQPIITGQKVIKIVPNGLTKGSIIKKSDVVPGKINLQNIAKDKNLNAIAYLLRVKLQDDSSYILSNSKNNSLDAETRQINDLNQKIAKNGGQINITTTLKDGTQKIVGPFNKAQKVAGTPKADAKLQGDNQDLYLSLKQGSKAGQFRQYGGKTDLAATDKKVLETNPFIEKCYNLIKLLFNTLSEKYNIPKDDYDFKYLRDHIQGVQVSSLSFSVPTNDNETLASLLKTKFGKDFSDKQSGINNVDVLIDGPVQLSDNGNSTYQIEGAYHTEWNPLKYKNNTAHNDETAANLYKFVINFIRYNANTDAKTNQLTFADFKHCRFQVYPNKKQMQNECVKTKQLFEKLGLETQFNELYKSQDIAQQSIKLKNLDIFCKSLIEQSKK